MQTHEVKAALRRRFKVEEYALMFEVGNATGSAVRRHADAVVMNLWPSRGLLIEGMEIKVSRSDWRREIENPAKAEEIAKFCDRWWVVTPAGIVQDHELPFNWGHMVVNENGGILIKKQAPKLEPVALTRGFVAAMLRRASEHDSKMIDKLVNAALVKEREQIAKEIERAVDARTKRFAAIEDKVAKLKELGISLEGRYETAEEFAQTYALGKHLMANYSVSGLKHTADNLERAVATIRSVDDALNAARSVQ